MILNWVKFSIGNQHHVKIPYKRFLSKFKQADNQRISNYFYKWIFNKTAFDNYTLDCDSWVVTHYGLKQEGARKGYNVHKPGRSSHHPLMAFVADVKLVANFWLRSGNSSASEGFLPFLEDTFQKLEGKKLDYYGLTVASTPRQFLITSNHVISPLIISLLHAFTSRFKE